MKKRLHGYADYGPTKMVTFVVGRKPGLDGPWAPGSVIPIEQVIGAVVKRRAAQIGVHNVELTSYKVAGYYTGAGEPSTKVEIYDTGLTLEQGRFDANMRDLGQQLAADLAQREVLMIRHNGRRTVTSTATPTGAPPATRADAFCAWVRKRSTVARTDPKDSCYRR